MSNNVIHSVFTPSDRRWERCPGSNVLEVDFCKGTLFPEMVLTVTSRVIGEGRPWVKKPRPSDTGEEVKS